MFRSRFAPLRDDELRAETRKDRQARTVRVDQKVRGRSAERDAAVVQRCAAADERETALVRFGLVCR